MKENKPIQVFEHRSLQVGTQGFTSQHWQAMGWYNEAHGNRFFTLTPNGVKFNQYVGVIQVGNLTIEVLPKIGQSANNGDEAKWQKVLIDMLRECRWMQVHAHEKAPLRFKANSILEAYLELFIQECESLVRLGLVKKYRSVEGNCTALKGKLIFQKHVQQNLVHKERFFTRHQVYDHEHIFNQLLLKALKLIPGMSQSPLLKDRVHGLLLTFPELEDIPVRPATFERLVYSRKTEHYREAIDIAAMLLLNYRPDVSSGNNHILAILFDMNDLWEEYIFRRLYVDAPSGWVVKPQSVKNFWELTGGGGMKIIKPDIIVRHHTTNYVAVLDTKWKLPDSNIPGDADLKQMFVYNEYFQAQQAFLIYPAALHAKEPGLYAGEFFKRIGSETRHNCSTIKVSVLDERNQFLDKKIGERLFSLIVQTFEKNEIKYLR